jgi:hypothetical protein
MSANLYHFEDHWSVPHPAPVVWDVLSQSRQYPAWWNQVYLSAEPLDGCTEPRVGGRVAVVAKGRLPYKLRFTVETLKLERPTLIEFKATGDFRTESSRWVLTPRGNSTDVLLDWNPIVEKPIIKLLSPILKPVFRWNHDWTMKVGQRQIIAYLGRR